MASKPYSANETIIALENVVSEDIQETALAALRNVIIGTPVGDPKTWKRPGSAPAGYVGGHARRNWNVSLDAARDTVVGTEGNGGGKGAATRDATERGTRTIDKAQVGKIRRIIIQNSVPYIGPLNNGHSKQAPANFVQKAVQAAGVLVDNSRKDVP